MALHLQTPVAGKTGMFYLSAMLLRSKTGWIFAALYLAATAAVTYEALTCRVMMCDLVIIFALFPAGWPYQKIFSALYLWPGQTSYAEPQSSWPFIVLTIATNAALYYSLGLACSWMWRKLFRHAIA